METNLLKITLRLNAAFSFITGSMIIILNSTIMEFIGIESSLLLLGYMLLGFSVMTILASVKQPAPKKLIWSIIVMDILWVLGSAALLIFPNPLNAAGNWTIAIIAIFVADFAFFQYKGLTRLTTNSNT